MSPAFPPRHSPLATRQTARTGPRPRTAASTGSAILLFAIASLTACNGSARNTDFSSRAIPATSPDAIYTAGRAVLADEFDRIASADPVARRVETSPEEFTTRRDSGTARDLYRNPTRMRRYATLLVDQRGDEALARVRVDIERQDTDRAGQLERPYQQYSDYPHEQTPGQRDAATSIRQNVLWTKVRRDRELETQLLSQLARQLQAGEPATPQPARTPTDQTSRETQ